MEVLNAVTVADTFPADGGGGAQMFISQGHGSNGGYASIQTNDVFARLAYQNPAEPRSALALWTTEFHVPIGALDLAPGTRGIMFRNYVAGHAASVSGALSTPAEPRISIASGGQATPSASVAGGGGRIQWPGGSAQSNVLTLSHGLGAVPTAVVAGVGNASSGAGHPTDLLDTLPTFCAFNYTATTFQLFAQMTDASTPALNAAADFSWVATA